MSKFILCNACGSKIDDDANQCSVCGLIINNNDEEIDIEIDEQDIEIFTCDNCGHEVLAEDEVCPGCGLSFVEENDEDDDYDEDDIAFINKTLKHINNYFEEIECEYEKTTNEKFIGLKINSGDKYYTMYFSYKDDRLILTYRTDIEINTKYEMDITNMSYEDVLKIIDVIMNFNNELYE